MGRTGTDYEIHRIFPEVFLEIFYGRQYPHTAGVRNEAVSPDPKHKVLHETLFLGIDRGDDSIGVVAAGRFLLLAREAAHKRIRLENMSLNYLHFRRDFSFK